MNDMNEYEINLIIKKIKKFKHFLITFRNFIKRSKEINDLSTLEN